MKINLVLPTLTEASNPYWRPIRATSAARVAHAGDLPASGWKKIEPLWNFLIKTRHLDAMRPLLEAILSKVRKTVHSPAAAPGPLIESSGADAFLPLRLPVLTR